MKSDAVFKVGVLDVDILLLLKLFLREVEFVDGMVLGLDGESVFAIDADDTSASSSSSSSAEAGDKTPNFMSPNCAKWNGIIFNYHITS